ncbi:MAG: hypothetical protein PHO27_12065 [Sulfuricurvum sp.]|nr:hypothetical protein [Sulfuricurvum sp.]
MESVDDFIHAYIGKLDIPYLARLRDADIKGTDKLIEAIEKYGVVYIREV